MSRSPAPGRLLAVSPLPGVAGGETMLLRLLPRLAERGWEPLLTVPGGGRLRERARELGIETKTLPIGPPERRSAASYLGAALAPALAARARAVLLNGLPAQRLVPSLRLARRPAMLHVDNPLPEPPRAWSRRGFWSCVRAVVADSRHSAEECVAAGAPPERVHALAPPAWSGRWPPGVGRLFDRNGRGVRIGYVGTLEPRKGVDLLLEAAAGVLPKHRDATLTIVGEPPPGAAGAAYLARLRELARSSGAAERIELAGYRPDAAGAMTGFDIVVVPSLSEPFGTVAAEASAAGAAVVASDVDGLREVVVDGETGFLVPPGSALDLREHLESLLADHHWIARLAMAGLRHAAECFSPDSYAEQVDALLREL